jgi:hypothetical protein
MFGEWKSRFLFYYKALFFSSKGLFYLRTCLKKFNRSLLLKKKKIAKTNPPGNAQDDCICKTDETSDPDTAPRRHIPEVISNNLPVCDLICTRQEALT